MQEFIERVLLGLLMEKNKSNLQNRDGEIIILLSSCPTTKVVINVEEFMSSHVCTICYKYFFFSIEFSVQMYTRCVVLALTFTIMKASSFQS